MSELTEFINRLNSCDLIVLTVVGQDRTYCRFFLNGVYMDRLFVSDATVIRQLHRLKGAGDEVNAKGIAELRQLFVGV